MLVLLAPVVPAEDDGTFTYEYVTLDLDIEARTATLEIRGPKEASATMQGPSVTGGVLVAAPGIPGIGRCTPPPAVQPP